MSKTLVSQDALRQVLVNISDLFVRKDGAKVLSTNDFTTALKDKLEGLSNYSLTPATTAALGGIIVGAGLAVANDGTLSLDTLAISDIVGLADALAAKASASDLTTLAGVVNDASTGLATKAAAADLTTIANKVNHSTTGLDQRVLNSVYAADKATTDAAIAAKAAASDLTTLANKVNDASTGLDTKVASSTYTTKVGELETAIGNKVASSALFDQNDLIKSELLPSYVDDVVEGYYDSTTGKFYSDSNKTTEITGEQSKIYVDKTSNCSYRFGGSSYVLITSADIEMMTEYNVNAVFNDVFNTSLATAPAAEPGTGE